MDITKEQFDELFKEDKLFVVDFYASWCGPCKVIGPILEELATDFKDRAVIKKVNVDVERDLSAEYEIRSIPTILFFKNGELVEKLIGSASKPQLTEMIETHL